MSGPDGRCRVRSALTTTTLVRGPVVADDHPTESTFCGPEVARRRCAKCKTARPLSDFTRHVRRSNARSRYDAYCRECQRLLKAAWRQANPVQSARDQRRNNLRKHGLTVEDYEAM